MSSKLQILRKRPLLVGGIVLTLIGSTWIGAGMAEELISGHIGVIKGMMIFMIVPNLVAAGLSLVVLDILLLWWRKRKLGETFPDWAAIWNGIRTANRRVCLIVLCALGIAAAGTALFSFKAYHFTETAEFCGELCHTMAPVRTAHLDSPHANVDCVKCHLAPGAIPFIKAKLAGTLEVYKLFTNTFHRPIRAHLKKLPDPEGTCEKCHWGDNHWGMKPDGRVRYGYDMENSKRDLEMHIKVGGGTPTHGKVGGIHQRMLSHDLVFRFADEDKQEIARFTVSQDDGTEAVYDLYEKGERKYSDADVERFEESDMTCLDCHNRPAHQYLSLDETVDRAIETGAIDRSIPFIKKVAVAALAEEYKTKEEALAKIKEAITTYYTEHFQGRILKRTASLDRAIEAVQTIYRRNAFPSMNITQRSYAYNIGHRTAPGCFRCHGGKHVRRDTKEALETKCEVCHAFYEKARDSETLLAAPADDSFLHPFRHKKHFNQETNCWDCHGAASPYSQCKSCHEKEMASEDMRFECTMCHRPRMEEVTSTSCQPCHPTANSEMHKQRDHSDCLECHKPHQWKAAVDHESCASTDCHQESDIEAWSKEGTEHSICKAPLFKGVEALMNGLPTGPLPSAADGAEKTESEPAKVEPATPPPETTPAPETRKKQKPAH